MADETQEETTPRESTRRSREASAKAAEAPEVPPVKQEDWLPHLETNSAWKFFTDNVDVDYGEDTIAVDGLDYRQCLRAEHAARIILEIYGFQVKGSIEPLRLVVEEA